ncbi:acyltransferase [Cryobacterium sp. TMT2-23]|uniref:acyltransferase family protein n=1 Tax=Cryobacterium sp. TMT2-23 TaxID=1259252 RepID=UPI00141BAEA3|nr:acyltransferase [Cryobacterium sp. TMT2-23]
MTGLRYLAAVHVVLTHTSAFAREWPVPIRHILDRGFVGVSLFFILSGFILAYTYLDTAGQTLRGNKKDFWVSRFARIYPLYVVGLLVAAPIFVHVIRTGLVSHPDALQALILTPMMLQAWSPTAALAWNSPAWSLSAEVFFYAMFPFVLGPLARIRGRKILWLMFGIWLVSLGLAASQAILMPDLLWQEFVIHVPATRIAEFIIGVLLGVGYVRFGWRPPSWSATASMIAIVAALALSPDFLPHSIISNALLVPLFCLLILGLTGMKGAPVRILSHPWFVVLGEASFAVYLLHIPLYRYYYNAGNSILPGFSESAGGILLFIVVVTSIAIAMYYFVEVPSRRVIRRSLLDKRHEPRSIHAR